ncbi:MAG: hypothetical protein Q8761_02755, partial [Sweet potato little leaf phytoplasma]|nr:hypothetical protein [Sweet potato little leaf phytoplasma]
KMEYEISNCIKEREMHGFGLIWNGFGLDKVSHRFKFGTKPFCPRHGFGFQIQTHGPNSPNIVN